ncbi:hypothetical protein MAPG_00848 [Magnaporthiopsis poae ATCC 64411]|uniref:NADH dehydrogenase [ubiquinone] iron-sulfur protein 4, mitochondrial n=1 Tax=Magnaporthiopsis poae (strain ATCC 64411 / 73-15) TaxID=644358 RepID=A0A0C4DM48_MAGP6|nr:hypothetical protein MAPG_00848 [Magnaporthiopsis poae ATCC 64411]
MASLRLSSASAARVLRSASQVRPAALSSIMPAGRRNENTLAPIKQTAAPAVVKPSQPDYQAHFDKATSTFTPVPKRVLDGSEPTDVLPAAIISGAPMELQARTVRIYKPSKPATQSGTHGLRQWRMDWDVLEKGHRWENPLMGWQSSGDFMQGSHLYFRTKEDAIAFAEKQGYEYFVQEPNVRKITPKAYANNFLYSDKKLKHIRTK